MAALYILPNNPVKRPRRQLGFRPPTAQQALENLTAALEQQAVWEDQAQQARQLLSAMLQSRKQAAEMRQQYGFQTVPADGAQTAAGQEGPAVPEPADILDEVN